jgi:hypothetical protein
LTEIVLHEEAFEELRNAFVEAGLLIWDIDMIHDEFNVGDITFRLWEYIPTPDEIARNETFAKSPLGQICAAMFKRANDSFIESLNDRNAFIAFMKGEQWPVRNNAKIRLPNDYAVTDGPTSGSEML